MIVKQRNKLFDHLYKEHDILLTGKELDEVVDIVNEENETIKQMIDKRLMKYRGVNILALLILAIVGWETGIKFVLLLFLIYNFVHILILLVRYDRWYIGKKLKEL